MSAVSSLDFGNLPETVVGLLCMLTIRFLMREETKAHVVGDHCQAERCRVLIRVVRKWGRYKSRRRANGDYAQWTELWADCNDYSIAAKKEESSFQKEAQECSKGPPNKKQEGPEGPTGRDPNWM
ncbi:putative protein V2 [Apiscitlodal virus]